MAFGSLIKSFSAPVSTPGGIAFNGKNLLVTCGDNKIHEIDRITGNEIRKFSAIGIRFGLALMGNLLLQENGNTLVYVTDLEGNLLYTLPAENAYPYGLAWLLGGMIVETAYDYTGLHNSYLVFRDRGYSWKEIYRVNVTGVGMLALCSDGKDIYAGEYDPASNIVKIGVNGKVIKSASFPYRPAGIAFDGKSLWVSNDQTGIISNISID